jgi:hypothetical protein
MSYDEIIRNYDLRNDSLIPAGLRAFTRQVCRYEIPGETAGLNGDLLRISHHSTQHV